MRLRITVILCLAVAAVFMNSCTSKDGCDNHLMGSITEIENIDTLRLGSSHIYHIKVAGFNGCSSLESVTSVETGNSIVITGNIYNKGCTCTDLFPYFNGEYVFIPDTTGIFYLKFVNDLHEKYLTDTVLVVN